MNYNYDYTIIGDDLRQIYLAELLTNNGHRVCCYGLCSTGQLNASPGGSLYTADTLKEALSKAQKIIAPIPLCGKTNHLNKITSTEELSLDSLLEFLMPGQIFFAGNIPKSFKLKALDNGIRVYDLMNDRSFCRFNTIATAEGAICEAIAESPKNLHGSSCAILGYGKCGTTLSYYLRGMFCKIYAVSENSDERAAAMLIANQTGTLHDFYRHLKQFDFIFNTIPAPVISTEHLMRMKPDVTIIDIASAPGGLDHAHAKRICAHTKLCPGLPGKYAPLSSAEAIYKTIQNIIKEDNSCL